MLRLDPHAQREIREYAKVILEITRKVAPAATASFERHTLEAVRFSGPEMMELRRRLKQGEALGDAAECVEPRPCQEDQPTKLSKKELERFEEKLKTGRQL
jgi:thymidylate synthase (FAD)